MARHSFAAPLLAAALMLPAACGDGGTGADPVYTVILEADRARVEVGGTGQLTAAAYDSRGDEITGRAVRWSVSDSTVATIGANGVVTGRKEGTVRAMAEVGGERDTETLVVVKSFLSCSSTMLVAGLTAAGTLGAGDCEVMIGGKKKYVDVYRMNVARRQTVHFEMVGEQGGLDPYLYLYDGRGVPLAESDNYRTTALHARIISTLPVGDYYLVASSAAESASAPALHGAFWLGAEALD